jgi:hypothetical protein
MDTKKPDCDQGIHHQLTDGGIDAAQALYLFGREPHSWHFKILGSDPVQHPTGSDGHLSTSSWANAGIATGIAELIEIAYDWSVRCLTDSGRSPL